jgi:uncharacterized DUF497 family protein
VFFQFSIYDFAWAPGEVVYASIGAAAAIISARHASRRERKIYED